MRNVYLSAKPSNLYPLAHVSTCNKYQVVFHIFEHFLECLLPFSGTSVGDIRCWPSLYVEPKAKKPQTANVAIAAAAAAILTAFSSNFSAVGHFPGAGLALALFWVVKW